jgi:ATP-dependent RNA helicase DHX29
MLMASFYTPQLPAQSISIDRKIRTRLEDPKSALAIRFLREKWREIFNRKMKDPAAPIEPRLEPWLALVADAIKSPHREDDEEKKRKRQQERAQVKLSLTRHD